MIRSLVMLVFWGIATPLAALVMFPWTLITRDVFPVYRTAIWIARTGIRIAGVRVNVIGRDNLDPERPYVFMSNHASNLDPPVLIPLVPKRTSVLVKKELFRIPVLGGAMRIGELVPVDRSNRQRAIDSLREAHKVLNAGVNMTVFVEGTRSRDGKLLPFKKGPFYLAIEAGVAIVPVSIVGTHELLPKGKMFSRPGTVTVVFHDPIDPATYNGDREALMQAVREKVASALPQGFQ